MSLSQEKKQVQGLKLSVRKTSFQSFVVDEACVLSLIYREETHEKNMELPIFKVDAFTNRLFHGNQAAVCPLPMTGGTTQDNWFMQMSVVVAIHWTGK